MKKSNCTYDVAFEPMVNVSAQVADPEHPTDEEIDTIVNSAIGKLRERLASPQDSTPEDLSLLRLYTIGDKEVNKTILDLHP